MKIKSILLLVLLLLVLSLGANVLFGSWLKAQVSANPTFSKWSWFKPDAPVVIRTTEQIKVSSEADLQKAAQDARSQLCGLYAKANDNSLSHLGGCLNVTRDGVVLTLQSLVGDNVGNLFVKSQAGNLSQVESVSLDPSTKLAFLKTSLKDISVSRFAESQKVLPGQAVVLVSQLPFSSTAYVLTSVVSKEEGDGEGVLSSEDSTVFLNISVPPGYVPGQAVVNSSGEVMGLVTGEGRSMGATTLNSAVKNYLANGGKVVRPFLGFTFQWREMLVGGSIAQELQVVSVSPKGAAQKAGLKPGDVLRKFSGQNLAEHNLQAVLGSLNVGGTAEIEILRQDKSQSVVLQY